MSVQAITCALAQRGVSASEKLLLLVLANYANEHMQCWPSQKKMAADTSLTERTVRALLAGLEARRFLSRVEHWRDDGSRGTDRLTLHFSGEVVTGTDREPEIISAPPETISGGTGNHFRGVPEAISALTTFEPPLRTSSEANASSDSVVGKPDDPICQAFEAWNQLADRRGLPKARKLDRTRRAAIRARLADGGLEAWTLALAAVERSPLCVGDNDRGWRADLDFVCQAKSWRRLLEGFYAPAPKATGPPVSDISRHLPLVPKTRLTDEEVRAQIDAMDARSQTAQ